MDILKLVSAGTRYKEIASTLFLSETSVNREMRNIFDRLGVNDAAHAVSEAYKTGLF
jgi:DNA-binding NarL/FixJ family response regulator